MRVSFPLRSKILKNSLEIMYSNILNLSDIRKIDEYIHNKRHKVLKISLIYKSIFIGMKKLQLHYHWFNVIKIENEINWAYFSNKNIWNCSTFQIHPNKWFQMLCIPVEVSVEPTGRYSERGKSTNPHFYSLPDRWNADIGNLLLYWWSISV